MSILHCLRLTCSSVILVFSGVFTFLVDSYPNSAASALAANGFARSMFAAMFPLFGPASESADHTILRIWLQVY